jgi:hypothetical protein
MSQPKTESASAQLSYRITRKLDEFREQLALLVSEDEIDQILHEELVTARQKVRTEIRSQMEPLVKRCGEAQVRTWVEGEHGTKVAELYAMRVGRELFQLVHEGERKRLLNECAQALAREAVPTNCVGLTIINKLNDAVQAEVDKLVTAWIASDGPAEIAEKTMEDLAPSIDAFDAQVVGALVMRDLPARATAMFNFEVSKAVLARSLQPLEVHVKAVSVGSDDAAGLNKCYSCGRFGQSGSSCQCGCYIS